MDLMHFFDAHMRNRLIATNVRASTVRDYERVARLAPAPCIEETTVRWLAALQVAPATRNKYRRYLMAMLHQARRRGLVGDWIDNIPTALEQQTMPRAWTVAEFARLLAAAQAIEEQYCGVAGHAWWRAFLLALWYSGARVDAMAAARWSNLDLGARTLVVRSAKTRRQVLYELPADLTAALRALGRRHGDVWPWPWRDRKKTRLRRMRFLIDQADLPQLEKPFHAIRRSVASYVAARLGTAVACDALQHSRPGITARYYIDPRIYRQLHQAAAVMPRPT